MGQPVRKIIKETHPEINVKPFYTLLVDGNNLLRLSMADTKTNGDGNHYGGIFQFFLQIKKLLNDPNCGYKYDYVYVVFDDTDSGILRYQIYNEYKANRDKKYANHLVDGELSEYWKNLNQTISKMENAIYSKKKKKTNFDNLTEEEIERKKKKEEEQRIIDENFARERFRVTEYCTEMSIRVLFDKETEGDDFIAYYVNHKRSEERIVIVSTDNDLTQLISPTVCVYNKMLGKYLSVKNFQKIKGIPVENVVIKKIFCGDTSDNIGNIKGLSEARLMELMPEMAERPITVSEVKERAQKLIDERRKIKKKPLQWHENIINGVSNKEYNGDFYEINEKIIDLKKPLLTKEAEEEISNMMYTPMDPEGRSFENLYKMIRRDGIEELENHDAFASFFVPFIELSKREEKRYKEYLKNNE